MFTTREWNSGFTFTCAGNAQPDSRRNTLQGIHDGVLFKVSEDAHVSLDFDPSTSPGYLRMFNPFAQGGWPNAANPNAGSSGTGSSPQPSIFGALPCMWFKVSSVSNLSHCPLDPTRNPTPMFMTFRFTQFSPTIMDSTVIANSRTYFRVKTDVPTVGYTVIHNSANQPTIVIEWLKHPVIEIRDILSKRQTSQWLELSADKTFAALFMLSTQTLTYFSSYRTMTARGKTFLWVPDGSHISVRVSLTAGSGHHS
jgi:hypothetical protein